ncbi:hypothetical protein mRhiFer1_010215 [Rhinolophus ferrumequinum]|uniref:Uncharacterized protein n=1 Tax=Rhinolophus ferrumequinum TaxID=59479 RepID=A0A7J7X566_RHIFE|nr:hypothetical protein mRhiFer1_010215 [Rhinolophus ferrumequinum]
MRRRLTCSATSLSVHGLQQEGSSWKPCCCSCTRPAGRMQRLPRSPRCVPSTQSRVHCLTALCSAPCMHGAPQGQAGWGRQLPGTMVETWLMPGSEQSVYSTPFLPGLESSGMCGLLGEGALLAPA